MLSDILLTTVQETTPNDVIFYQLRWRGREREGRREGKSQALNRSKKTGLRDHNTTSGIAIKTRELHLYPFKSAIPRLHVKNSKSVLRSMLTLPTQKIAYIVKRKGRVEINIFIFSLQSLGFK